MHFFDLQHTLFAKHAQHIVLVHFPIALVCVALLFDLMALRWRDRGFAAAAYYNLSIGAAAVLPVAITGLLAWKYQLEGEPIRGVLRLHLALGVSSVAMTLMTWFVARRSRGNHSMVRIAMEVATVMVVAATAHLGGIVSGIVS